MTARPLTRRLADRLNGLIAPFEAADGPPPGTLWAFFRWALKGTWAGMAIAAVVSAIAGTVEVVAALLLGTVIDTALSGGDVFEGRLPLYAGIVIFMVVLRPAAFAASTVFQSLLIQPNLMVLVLSRMHRWTMGQAIDFFDNDFAGRIAQKQMQSARALTEVMVEMINTVVFALASVIATAILVISINGWAAVMLMAWLAAYMGFLRHYMPRIRSRATARAATRAVVTGHVVDTVTNMRTVKLFAHAEHEDQAAIDAMRGFRTAVRDYGVISVAFRAWLMVLAGVLPVVLVGSTLLMFSRGAASAGDIAATGAVALRISQMTGWVSFTLMNVYSSIGEVEDGMRTISPAYTLTDRRDAKRLSRGEGIAFEGVSFAYGRRTGGVENIDLTIAPGEKVGVVGASGAGKSTLVSLLLRLYDVEAGRVTVSGLDVRDVTQESLRRQIAMVTQETAMFNRSARANILYGRPDATEAEVIEAAQRAEAHDFILGLRDYAGRRGYDAYLGERGVKLSGGQRQRVALARALLKDAPILVLDEATSALDSEIEASIQRALEQAMEGKTVIAIAHRLSTLRSMDRIVVLEAGHIVEEGSHDDLLARGGVYARFWNRQSGGFIAQDAAE